MHLDMRPTGIDFDSWMEQALTEYQRKTCEFESGSQWIGDAVASQEHGPADSSQSARSDTNQEYERVIYDPRLEQALLEFQRKAEGGRNGDPVQLRKLLHHLGQRISQDSGYETISGYERVQYEPRLEQVLLEISQRRPKLTSIHESASCATANGEQEGNETNLVTGIHYDSWMEQEYQKRARESRSEGHNLASQEGESAAPD